MVVCVGGVCACACVVGVDLQLKLRSRPQALSAQALACLVQPLQQRVQLVVPETRLESTKKVSAGMFGDCRVREDAHPGTIRRLPCPFLDPEPPMPALMPVACATAFRNHWGSDCHSA